MCDRLARAITCMFCHDLHLILLYSGLLQKDLAELYFKQNSCHTRIAAIFPLPSCCISGFLLRFEVGGTNIAITGTKEGGGATILARSAKSGYM